MGIGAVCHTLNPRLFNADLEYIVARAADCIVIVDASLVAKLAQVLPACPSVRHVVVMDGIRPVTDDLRNDDSGIQIFAGHDPASRQPLAPVRVTSSSSIVLARRPVSRAPDR
jgi:acyl-CoA synthetase (AMP-forming)/AMP-acid ligase II